MRVAQTIAAVALAAAGVVEATDAVVKQSTANGAIAQNPVANVVGQSPAVHPVHNAKAAAIPEALSAAAPSPSSSPSSEAAALPTAEAPAKAEPAKAEPKKAEAKKDDGKKAGGVKDVVEKVKAVTNLAFGKVERKKERTAKQGADYVRKQKSAAEITADASGTQQPASLSDPKVNLMEAMADMLKRYAGQTSPDKAQLQEDIKTVFESRAEKGDLTTKQFRQHYKVRELTPNGVGKPKPKTKRDLESRDLESEAEIEIAAREAEAEPEDDFEFTAREADPEAEVYEDDADLITRESAEDEDAFYFARGENSSPSSHLADGEDIGGSSTSDSTGSKGAGRSDSAAASEWSYEKAGAGQDAFADIAPKIKSAKQEATADLEEEMADIQKKKAALKKAIQKLARKQRLSKKLAAKKRMLAKKLAAKRKAAAYDEEEAMDEFSSPIPPTRPERPFYRAPSERRSLQGAMHYPRAFDPTMGRMW